jgi:hypothetical protein
MAVRSDGFNLASCTNKDIPTSQARTRDTVSSKSLFKSSRVIDLSTELIRISSITLLLLGSMTLHESILSARSLFII